VGSDNKTLPLGLLLAVDGVICYNSCTTEYQMTTYSLSLLEIVIIAISILTFVLYGLEFFKKTKRVSVSIPEADKKVKKEV